MPVVQEAMEPEKEELPEEESEMEEVTGDVTGEPEFIPTPKKQRKPIPPLAWLLLVLIVVVVVFLQLYKKRPKTRIEKLERKLDKIKHSTHPPVHHHTNHTTTHRK